VLALSNEAFDNSVLAAYIQRWQSVLCLQDGVLKIMSSPA
jgi:hypothetical protein